MAVTQSIMAARPGGDLELRERFLLPSEAARLLGVATSTLRRWAEEGKIHSGTTIGGHRRYREREITRLAQGLGLEEVVAN
jgi:excisionase family DNA binding protein